MPLVQAKPEPKTPTGLFTKSTFEKVVHPGMSPFDVTNELVIICETGEGAITLNLRNIDKVRGSMIHIHNVGDNDVTITPFSNDTILGMSQLIVPENGAVMLYAPIYAVDDWKFFQAHRLIIDTTDVSDPPTDAELDSAFGTPANLGEGYMRLIDDNSGDADVWLVATNDTSWWYVGLTKAV